MPDVKLEVEIRVLDPVGVVQAHGHGDQALPKCARFVQALLEESQDVLERYSAARGSRLIVDGETANMHGHVARFQVKKRRIESG